MTTTNDYDTALRRRVHPVHVGHLVMGLAFLGLVGVWAALQYDVVPTEDVRWLMPLPWVFAGVAGLLAVTLSARGRGSAAPTRTAATVEDAETTEDAAPETTDAMDTTEENR